MSDVFEDVEANLGPADASSAKVRKVKTVAKQAKVKIVLEENEEIPPTGLFIGLNGVGYLIRPGEEVEVPYGVKEVLEHAVMSMPAIDPVTKQVLGYRDRMRYPFRVVNS